MLVNDFAVGAATFCRFADSTPAVAGAVGNAAGACTSNALTVCGLPSCSTTKSDAFKSFIGRPWLSVTTTSNCTRRVLTRIVAVGASLAGGNGGTLAGTGVGAAGAIPALATVTAGGAGLGAVASDAGACGGSGGTALATCVSAAGRLLAPSPRSRNST